jgi:hypothetical protein
MKKKFSNLQSTIKIIPAKHPQNRVLRLRGLVCENGVRGLACESGVCGLVCESGLCGSSKTHPITNIPKTEF